MPTIGERARAAMNGWLNPGSAPSVDPASGRYDALYHFWEGSWRASNMFADQRLKDRPLYKNTRQLWRQADAVVALYAQFVYAGNSLSTDGNPLSDGTRGAIPIDAQAGGTPDSPENQALRNAIAEWWTMTNYRQFMSMRPKFGAILGDVLTELVEDQARGVVMPQLVWPGYVTYLQLDMRGNVQAYSVEWDVDIPERTLFGQRQEAQSYRYRKDVNRDAFYFYRDDRLERQVPNPYGFVPAVWDRHEIVFGDRGLSAIDKTYQQAVELNSVLSNALDYQSRQFGAPIGVKGAALSNRNNPLKVNRGASTGDPLHDAAMVAQKLGLLPMTDNGDFVTANFDPGKVIDLMTFIRDSMQAENPEGSFSQHILEMTQVTAPGIERALGPIIGRVKDARKNYDTQTVKLIQMALSMIGWRVNTGGYDPLVIAARRGRYEKFRPYTLDAFGRGLMDFIIPDREVIPDTIDERIARQVQIEQLTWEYSLQVAGVPPDVIADIMQEREEEKERMAALDRFAAETPELESEEPGDEA